MTAYFHNMKLHFSVQKRKNRNGDYTYTYIVSNMRIPSKQYLYIYQKRWEIEKLFRTLKQSIGFTNCLSNDIDKQKVHIYSTFFAYAFLQNEKYQRKFCNPEAAQKYLAKLKSHVTTDRIASFIRNFYYVA